MYLELINNIEDKIEHKEKIVLQLQNKYNSIINLINVENTEIQYYDTNNIEL